MHLIEMVILKNGREIESCLYSHMRLISIFFIIRKRFDVQISAFLLSCRRNVKVGFAVNGYSS